MSKLIGRLFNVGAGREVTRGTGRAPQYWLPRTELTFDEKVDLAKDESSIGVIENQQDADVVKSYGEGTLSGIINDDSFGLILNATLGTSVTTGPTDSAYTHTYTVKQSAQHQSLTLFASEPNAETTASLMFPLVMADSLELNFEVGAYPTYSMSFMSNIGSATTTTVSYTAPDNFKPQDGSVRIHTAYTGLDTGTAYSVSKASISISKNLEDDHNIGSVAVTDRLNKQFQVSGSFEMVYNARTNITELLAGSDRAMQLKFTNTAKTIGASTNPSITINIAKIKLSEVARSLGNDDLVRQTVNFEGYYSIADSKSVECIVVNDVASYV